MFPLKPIPLFSAIKIRGSCEIYKCQLKTKHLGSRASRYGTGMYRRRCTVTRSHVIDKNRTFTWQPVCPALATDYLNQRNDRTFCLLSCSFFVNKLCVDERSLRAGLRQPVFAYPISHIIFRSVQENLFDYFYLFLH